MAGLLQLVQGLGKVAGGFQQRKFGKEEARLGEKKYEDQLKGFRRGQFDAKVSGEMAKTRTLASGLAADATRRATERAAAQQQQLISGAGRGDVRGLASAAGQARQLELAAQQAQQAGAQTILGAQQDFGKYAAGVQAQNESTRRQLEAMELARGAARFDAGRLTQQEGTQTMFEGGTEGVAGGAQMMRDYLKNRNTVDVKPAENGIRVKKEIPETLRGLDTEYEDIVEEEPLRRKPKGKFGASRKEEEELEELREKVKELEGSDSEDKPREREKTDISKMLAILSAPSGRFAEGVGQRQSAGNEFMEEGGYVGEEGGVTEGEFSHEENPIDMINQEGDKVGEVTGGEFVFNDEQSALMKELIERNEPEMLIKFMRDLLSQPQFK